MSTSVKPTAPAKKEQTVAQAIANVDAKKAIPMPKLMTTGGKGSGGDYAFDLAAVERTKLSPQLAYTVYGYVHLLNERGLDAGVELSVEDLNSVVIKKHWVENGEDRYLWVDLSTGNTITYKQDVSACLTCSGNQTRMKAIRITK